MAFPLAAAGIVAGAGSILSGILGGGATKKAAKKQSEAIAKANEITQQAFGATIDIAKTQFDKASALLKPFAAGGSQLFQLLVDETSKPVKATESFLFQQEQGEKAITRAAAARGEQFSGSTLETISTFNRGLLAAETDKLFNRRRELAEFGGGFARAGAELEVARGREIGGLTLGAAEAEAASIQGQGFAKAQGQFARDTAFARLPGQIGGLAGGFISGGGFAGGGTTTGSEVIQNSGGLTLGNRGPAPSLQDFGATGFVR